MINKMYFLKTIFLATCLFLSLPIFSQTFYNSFDRATGNGQGTIEASIVAGRQIFSFDGDTEAFTSNIGFRGGYSILDYLELKVSWSRSFLADNDLNDDLSINFIEFTPKFIFPGGKFAISLPIGRRIFKVKGGGVTISEGTTYLTPELMFNHEFSPKFELGANLALVQFIGEEDGIDSLVRFNINAGFSKDRNKWVVRPEMGIVFDPGEEGSFLAPGVGFNYYIQPVGSDD